jgi:hypothetical protein
MILSHNYITNIRTEGGWKFPELTERSLDFITCHFGNMVQYHDTIRMVNFINPPSTIGIVVDLYPLYSASLPVVPLVR